MCSVHGIAINFQTKSKGFSIFQKHAKTGIAWFKFFKNWVQISNQHPNNVKTKTTH